MVGTLEQTGIGVPLDVVEMHPNDIDLECREHNHKLVANLKQDPLHEALLVMSCKDAQMGRMSQPKVFETADVDKVMLLHVC